MHPEQGPRPFSQVRMETFYHLVPLGVSLIRGPEKPPYLNSLLLIVLLKFNKVLLSEPHEKGNGFQALVSTLGQWRVVKEQRI